MPAIAEKISIPRQNLTDEEIACFMEGFCPDCLSSKLKEGPQGGCNINTACAHCGSEFNLCPPALSLSHRNTPRGEPNRDRLKSVFGIVIECGPSIVA